MRKYLALLLLLFVGACGPGKVNPDFHPSPNHYRVESNYRDRIVLYWVVAGSRLSTAAEVGPYDALAQQPVPPSLIGSTDLRLMACVGRWTPQTKCALLDGRLMQGQGHIVTIFASFAGMVN